MTRSRELAELASAYDSGNSFGFRNRIINGDMRIDQRNAGAAVTAAGYCVDRWNTDKSFGMTYTQQQVADAPAGFTNSLKITVTTPGTPTAGQFTFSRQIVEGNNIADLAWGTANAVPVTVSVWVKASITGAYAVFLVNSAEDRSYVATVTVNAANTWEQKSFTVPGDTAGTWLTNNSNGIRFGFDLGSGSNFQGTANAWNTGWKQRTSGTVNFCQTSGATFQYTGVQLEAGTVASPFERRDYGRELMMCQRYFEKSFPQGIAPANGGSSTTLATVDGAVYGMAQNRIGAGPTTQFKVSKRAVPTMQKYGNSSGDWVYALQNATGFNGGANSGLGRVSESSFVGDQQVQDALAVFVVGHWTASAEL